MDIFCPFLAKVMSLYNQNSNPYHNYEHAITVTHAMYMLLTKTDAASHLDELDQFVLMFSSLMHDIDHTGRTNTFESQSFSALAIKYNDKSVRHEGIW